MSYWYVNSVVALLNSLSTPYYNVVKFAAKIGLLAMEGFDSEML